MIQNQNRSTKLLNYTFYVLEVTAFVSFIVKKEYNCLLETVLIIVGYSVFIHIEKSKNFQVKSYIRALVIASILSNTFGGELLELYKTSKYFDKFLHVFGTFTFSLLAYSVINTTIANTPNKKLYISIFITSLGAIIGVAFEILEFIADVVFKANSQSGLVDTNLDLIFDLIGALGASIFELFYPKEKQP